MALSKDCGVHHTESYSSYGKIDGHENLHLVSLSQEMGIVKASPGHKINFEEFHVGKLIKILPNHSCLSAAHFDKFHVVDEYDTLVDVWETSKREW